MLKIAISNILASNYGIKSHPIVILICIYCVLVSWGIFKVLKVWNFISVVSFFCWYHIGFQIFKNDFKKSLWDAKLLMSGIH